ncbi:conserved membrane hypothetical protein [Micromonospora lupini str. Lupac 08]|uniref:Uncharacterized protein n=2 Tax=Micromonospora lupini TaxID=285679 RepID=I0LC28_9ACTN|nr:conserved membrane hypothetical protein [Micromonospora lupini str. Lupac 08]
MYQVRNVPDMAFRTWGRLLLTALGVSVLAGAGQLGVAYGFGIVRLTGAFTGTTVNQWPAQLVWVGWFAANAAVAGAVLTGRLARRDAPPPSIGRQLAIGGAAALGATAVAPLCMQPARAAELISVDPVWAVGICAILGAVIGAGAAVAVLFRPELGWNMAAVAGAVWLLALISVLPSLGTAGALPTVRLGVLEPNWLDDAAAQRLALLLLPVVALLTGAATAGLARWRGQVPLVSGATGVAGPVLVAFAYLTAGPGDAVDRYQTTPYYGALIAILAGALGAAAAALLRWPVGARTAAPQAIEPTDILRPLPAGPPLPGTEAATSTDPVDDRRDTEPTAETAAAGGQLADTGPGPRAADDTATVRTVPAHWDWPATTASGQHGPVPADATRPEQAPRQVGRRQRTHTAPDVPKAGASTEDALRTGGQHDRGTNPPAPASWLTDPTGEFTAGRQSTPSSRDGDTPTVPASTAATSAAETSTLPAGDTGAVDPTPDAGGDDPTGRNEPGSDHPTTGNPVAPVTGTAAQGTTSTSVAGSPNTPVADDGQQVAGSTSTPVAGSTGTPVLGDGPADSPAPKPRRTRKPKSAPVGSGTIEGTAPAGRELAATEATSGGGPTVTGGGTPKASTPDGDSPVAGAGLPAPADSDPKVADGAAHAPTEAAADDAAAPPAGLTSGPVAAPAAGSATDSTAGAGSTGGRTAGVESATDSTAGAGSTSGRTAPAAGTIGGGMAAAAGSTGGRTRRPARSGKAIDVTGADSAGAVDQGAPLPGQDAASGQENQADGKDPQGQTAGMGGESRRAGVTSTEPEGTDVGGGDPAPVERFSTGRAEPSATEGDGRASSLFGEATADAPTTDRWTPAAPAWPVTSAWTTEPETETTAPEASASDAPVVAEDWTPRFRHRAPLPDLSRASTWDAFNTTRRTSDRTASTTDQGASTPDLSASTPELSVGTPGLSGPTDPTVSRPGRGGPTDSAASTTDQGSPSAATLGGTRSRDRAASTTDQDYSTPDRGNSTTDRDSSTTGRVAGRRGRLADAAGASAAAGRVVPPSAGPGIPEQGGTSGTADRGTSATDRGASATADRGASATDRGASGTADTGGTDSDGGPDSDARRAEATSTDGVEQPSRRGRLGGLFRRNRARADEEKRPAADAAEPLATQDEEFVDWVAGLGKPIADNEPEQENGRRSLRSTGRHHRD